MKAASEHVRHYGYQKTTVADVAKAVHLSTAYLYNFFNSKQAIGDAVCSLTLKDIIEKLAESLVHMDSPGDSIMFILSYMAETSARMIVDERKIHDLVALSFHEGWESSQTYRSDLLQIVRLVVMRGREMGEFERKSPLDENCEAIRHMIEPFFHPILIQQNPRDLADEAIAVAKLIRRSLTL